MIRKIALAAALASIGCGSAIAAPEQTYTHAAPLTVGDTAAYNFAHIGESGSLYDHFNFTITSGSVLSASAVSINLASLLGISGLTGTLWDNHHPSGSFIIGTFSGDNSTNSFNLGAGDYHIDFGGLLSGTAGGSYLASITVSAVPEPESYAMLLAGLGIMGAIARRRSAQKA